jgi:hypothetical protein
MHVQRSLLFVVACLLCATSLAQPATRRIRGEITGVDGLVLQVRTRLGENVTIALDEKYGVSGVVKADVGMIQPGTYVGTATLPQPDGTQRALEVLVFPEAARGSNEGHYPWDLQPGSMMTNATVAQIVRIDPERRMTLRYKDGEKVIIVPPDAPIVTFEPGDRDLVKVGAHVLITATVRPDGSLSASRITVGKNGLVPPM